MTKTLFLLLSSFVVMALWAAAAPVAHASPSERTRSVVERALEPYTVIRPIPPETKTDAEKFGPPVPVVESKTPDADEKAAQVKKAENVPFKEEGVSFDAEGFGLYHSVMDGGLGKDMWDESKRSTLISLLETMPVTARYAATQHLLFGILLTSADPANIKNDEKPEAGRDLLSIRLRKLIDAGAYRQAIELYSRVPDEATSESIVRSGIYAMLFTGEEYLACVELKTVIDRYISLDFFKTLNAYCDVTLSDMPDDRSWDILRTGPDRLLVTLASDKKWMFDYNAEQFAELSYLERAMIIAENRLRSGTSRRTDFKNVPATDVQLLMKATDLTDKDKFLLNLRALEWGLLSVDDLSSAYKAAIDPDIRKDPALSVPASAEDWQRLPYLLQLATNKTLDSEKWDFIRQAFPIGQRYGLAALTPFADILSEIKPVNPSLQDLQTVLAVLVRAERPIPQQIIDIIKEFKFDPAAIHTEKALLTVALIAQTTSTTDPVLRERILKIMPQEPDLSTLFLRNIIENIDKHDAPDHNASRIYDNKKNLTLPVDYVMPSKDVWNHLIEASRKGLPGETVLLSAKVLNENAPDRLHPDAFQNVLQSLKFVGLTDISRNLAMEVVLGGMKN